jgi:catechol 2,3-dioxygenase-like lactoylglutathione lyase family enzyme
MLLTEIDHIAIAVHDLEAAIAYYEAAFGARVHHREVVERDGVEEALLKVADSYIQLTTPTRPDSPSPPFWPSGAKASITWATGR